ncbi:MAG TPA: hypothetical protein DCG28_02315 [Lachnospiraceae bacterium]|nr:hypothetical protein [Lachnospiraceae bacterium]
MKRRLVALGIALVILAGLGGVYFLLDKKGTVSSELSSDTTESTTSLLQGVSGKTVVKSANIVSFSLKNQNGSLNAYKKDDKWYVEGLEDADFSQEALSMTAYALSDITAARTIDSPDDDIAKYGITEFSAKAIGKSEQGETVILTVGDETSDGKYRYVAVEGEKRIYMISSASAQYYMGSVDDYINKSVDSINADGITYIKVTRPEKDEIEIEYDPNNALTKGFSEGSGLAALIMNKPYENAIVYPFDLKEEMLSSLNELKPEKLVSAEKTDGKDYGLDKPKTHIELKDSENRSIIVDVGDSVTIENEVYRYARFNGKNEIFLTSAAVIADFENADASYIIQPFIALHPRSNVEKIEIKNKDKDYTVFFKTEGDKKIAVDDEGVKRDNRNTYINDKLIEKEKFSDFYEAVTGISFDDIITDYTIEGNVTAKIEYTLSNGETDSIEFHDYDSNFYITEKGKGAYMLVSKQDIRALVDYAQRLITEE